RIVVTDPLPIQHCGEAALCYSECAVLRRELPHFCDLLVAQAELERAGDAFHLLRRSYADYGGGNLWPPQRPRDCGFTGAAAMTIADLAQDLDQFEIAR